MPKLLESYNIHFVMVAQSKWVHSKLCSIIHAPTKGRMILRSFVVLIWMHDTME